MKPFKVPLPNHPSNRGVLSDATSESTSTSFSTIDAPNEEAQRRALAVLPIATQPNKKPKPRFQKTRVNHNVDWVFKHDFKKEFYKGRQFDVMEASMEDRDILMIAPTGMGKSLCFQVPAVATKHGLTIVISPLLSLMKDQIQSLQTLGIAAVMLSSKTSREEQNVILEDMASGHPKNRLLYITPERLSSAAFRKRLDILYRQRELVRLVVDEAHCISEWGHDFRPDYAKIGNFRADFPKIPIMALTASATPKVQHDIVSELCLDEETIFKVIHSFNRMNLFYEVRYYSDEMGPDHRKEDLLSFIQKISIKNSGNGISTPGILYCRTKNTCDDLSNWLRSKGVMAAPYHRGLKDLEADQNQARWISNDHDGKRVDCIVATVAFGMGIDKANCRYVIHYDIPKSFEGFYQETGRAGRDSHAARCLLYYSDEDKARVSTLVGKSHNIRVKKARTFGPEPSQRAPNSIEALFRFAENTSICRHILICRYFGEVVDPKSAADYCNRLCDVCKKGPEATRARRDRGLICMDFAQTQAVTEAPMDDFDEDIDPDDYYKDETKSKNSTSDESDVGEVDDVDSVPEGKGKAREGIILPNEDSKDSLDDVESEVDNDEVQVLDASPNPTQYKRKADSEETEIEWPTSSPPVQKKIKNSPPLFQSDDDVEIPVEPIPSKPIPSKSIPSTTSVQHSAKENQPSQSNPIKSIIAVKQTLPAVGIHQPTRNTPAFVPPFEDPARRAGYNASGQLKGSNASSSVISDVSIAYKLDPLLYEKKISKSLREEAVESFEKNLAKAFLSKHGKRSSESEEKIWKSLGGQKLKHEMRRKVLMATAVEIESDLFWIAISAVGYRQFYTSRLELIQELITFEGDLPNVGAGEMDEVTEAFRRVVTRFVVQRKKNKS